MGVAKVVNLGYGAFITLTAYIYSTLAEAMDSHLAALLAIPLATAIGTAGYIVLAYIRRLELVMLVVSLSIALFIEGALYMIYGPYQRVVPLVVKGSVGWLPAQWLVSSLVAGLAIFVYYAVLKTQVGRRMVAVAENPELALSYGIDRTRVDLFTLMLSSLFAAIAAVMISPFLTITPHASWLFLLTTFAVVIVGGVGSAVGSIVAGLIISFAERLSAYYLEPSVQPFVPVALILGVLLARPHGIFGKEELRWA